MNKKNKPVFSVPIGAGLIIVSSFFYASYGIWTTLMGDFFDGYTASALRSILVATFLLAFAIPTKSIEKLDFKLNWKPLLGMFIAALFTWGPLYYAILGAGVAISLATFYASVLIGMFFFGWLIAKEKITSNSVFSAILGLFGLALIFSPNLSVAKILPLLAAVVSGLSVAGASVFTKKLSYKATQSTLMLWITSILANILMVFLLHKPIPAISMDIEWIYLVIFSVSSVAASWTFIKGLKLIDAGAAGVLGLLEIVFGVIFGVVLFQEQPSAIALIGVAVVIFSAGFPYFKKSTN